MDAARAAFQAWTLGYSAEPDPDIFPLGKAARVSCHAAIEAAQPGQLDLDRVYEAGQTEARRQALHRNRDRLYAHHAALIGAAAAGIGAEIDGHTTARLMLLVADQPRDKRKAQALTALTAALGRSPETKTKWATANAGAYAAATARGKAEATVSINGGKVPSPAAVVKAEDVASVDDKDTWTAAYDWLDQQLASMAGTLADIAARGELPTADELAKEIQTAINAAEGPRWWAEEQMVGAWSTSFVATAKDVGGEDQRLFWWSAEDDRVCPSCDENEAENPYTPATIPDCPDHYNCRCDIEAG